MVERTTASDPPSPSESFSPVDPSSQPFSEHIASLCDITEFLEELQKIFEQSRQVVLNDAANSITAAIEVPPDCHIQATVAQALEKIAEQRNIDSANFAEIKKLRDPTSVHLALQSAAQHAEDTDLSFSTAYRMASEVIDAADIHLRNSIDNHVRISNDFLSKMRGEIDMAASAMEHAVATAEKALLTRQHSFLAVQRSEFDSLLAECSTLSKDLMTARLEKRTIHHDAMRAIREKGHVEQFGLHRDLADRIAEATCQLSTERGTRLFARDELRYNCRILG